MSILDPKFKYVPSYATDARATIEREKRRLRATERRRRREARAQQAETARIVTPIARRKP